MLKSESNASFSSHKEMTKKQDDLDSSNALMRAPAESTASKAITFFKFDEQLLPNYM